LRLRCRRCCEADRHASRRGPLPGGALKSRRMPIPDSPVAVDALRSSEARANSRRLRPALARRAVSQREANGTAFDGTGRSTTRGASTQLRVCFSGGAELWARPEQRTIGLRSASWIGTTRLAGDRFFDPPDFGPRRNVEIAANAAPLDHLRNTQ